MGTAVQVRPRSISSRTHRDCDGTSGFITGVGGQLLVMCAELIPPIYVKPFLKRQKNDANDSEAIVAASDNAVRGGQDSEAQAGSMLFRTRDLLCAPTHANDQLSGVELAESRRTPQLRQGVAEAQCFPIRLCRRLMRRSPADIRARAREQEEIKRLMNPGRRTERDGGECLCAADGELPPGSRLRRLDRADATAEFDGRQATAWPHHKDGTARLAPRSFWVRQPCKCAGACRILGSVARRAWPTRWPAPSGRCRSTYRARGRRPGREASWKRNAARGCALERMIRGDPAAADNVQKVRRGRENQYETQGCQA